MQRSKTPPKGAATFTAYCFTRDRFIQSQNHGEDITAQLLGIKDFREVRALVSDASTKSTLARRSSPWPSCWAPWKLAAPRTHGAARNPGLLCVLSVLKDCDGSRLPYPQVCRILIKMADTFFSFSWRIREPHGCP